MHVIIQARTSSQRLPQKVIKDFANKSMILWTCERVQQAKHVTDFMIATSNERSDDPLANLAHKHDLPLYRGALEDVSGRFVDILAQKSSEAFMRISGDSPLIDPAIIDQAIEIYQEKKPDIVTNVHPRSFPKGQSVEILRAEFFLDTVRKFTTETHKEHVTSYFYEHDQDFNIVNFDYGRQTNHIQLSVDTASDHEKLEKMVNELGMENLTLENMIAHYESL